jgi:Glycosyl hydrolase family 99
MRRSWSFVLVIGAALLIAETSGCSHGVHQGMNRPLPNLQESSRILADYQPWFGDRKHINVGYSTMDPNVLRNQIQRARNMGIYGFAVDWYGERRPFEDRSYALLQRVAAENNFKVCLMYDEVPEDNGQATEDALRSFDKAYRDYIGPGAPAREAYITYQGRPVIFIFPKRGRTNWDRVREAVNQWETPPLLIYKDEPPPQYAHDFDGFYPWVHPSHRTPPDPHDWGKEYLETFYRRMQQRPGKIIVGGIWPGFDDSKASWSLNRRMDRRCGQTFEDTLKVFHNHNDPERPMPFVMVATWNDYEEGTQIENGISDCKSQVAREEPQ